MGYAALVLLVKGFPVEQGRLELFWGMDVADFYFSSCGFYEFLA
jgi:hypothetical protein